jgi:hypothetical protein
LRVPAILIWACALALCATGCAVRECSTISGSGNLSATPQGRTAVLRVEARATGEARTGKSTWGVVQTPHAEAGFADLLAHVARREAGLDVMLPLEAAAALERAEIKPTLQPAPKELPRLADLLGCASYLTAEVREWRYGYFFFASWATADFRVACYAANGRGPLWEAEVRRRARHMSDREVALTALRGMFDWLEGAASPAPECPPGETAGTPAEAGP